VRFSNEQTSGRSSVETLQAAGVRNGYRIAGDTLNRIAHANERGERGAPRRMRRSESEGGQAGGRRSAAIESSRRPSGAAGPEFLAKRVSNIGPVLLRGSSSLRNSR
jgi:hypothetical protein